MPDSIERLEAEVRRLHDELVAPPVPYRSHSDEAELIERYGRARQQLTQLRNQKADDERERLPAHVIPLGVAMVVIWLLLAIFT